MAIASVDEVMLREPRLLVPRQAPVGSVKLDSTGQLATKLLAAYHARDNVFIDLVRNKVFPGTDTVLKGTEYGCGLEFNGSTSKVSVGDVGYLVGASRFSIEMAVIPYAGSMNTRKQLFSKDGTNGREWIFNIEAYGGTNARALLVYFRDDYTYSVQQQTSGAGLQQNRLNHIVVCCNPAIESTQFSINGEITSGVNTGGDAYYLQDTVADAQIGARALSGYTEPFAGVIFYVRVFRGFLTTAEILSLYADPYQFLIPA
jgi:hypothetical protein